VPRWRESEGRRVVALCLHTHFPLGSPFTCRFPLPLITFPRVASPLLLLLDPSSSISSLPSSAPSSPATPFPLTPHFPLTVSLPVTRNRTREVPLCALPPPLCALTGSGSPHILSPHKFGTSHARTHTYIPHRPHPPHLMQARASPSSAGTNSAHPRDAYPLSLIQSTAFSCAPRHQRSLDQEISS